MPGYHHGGDELLRQTRENSPKAEDTSEQHPSKPLCPSCGEPMVQPIDQPKARYRCISGSNTREAKEQAVREWEEAR